MRPGAAAGPVPRHARGHAGSGCGRARFLVSAIADDLVRNSRRTDRLGGARYPYDEQGGRSSAGRGRQATRREHGAAQRGGYARFRPLRTVRRLAVPHHSGRRGARPATPLLSDRDRRRSVVAGRPARGGRPGHRGSPRRRRQAVRPAASAMECPHPRPRVRRPVLPAGSQGFRAARLGQRAGAARPRDRVR